MSKQIQLPSPGRIVNFTWGGGSGPAIVMSNSGSTCTLQVFSEANGVFKRTEVPYSEVPGDDHTWSWPEKVEGKFDYEKPEPAAEAPTTDGAPTTDKGKGSKKDKKE